MQVRLRIYARRCRLLYGVAPCTASGEASASCYNTRATCQDLANIDLQDQQFYFGTSNVPFTESTFQLAGGGSQVIRQRNTIISANIKSGRLELEGVASENMATLVVADEQGGLDDVDPYRAARDMAAEGSFWGRWLARDTTLQRSEAVLEYREIDTDPWVSTYWLVDEVTHPLNGKVQIKLVDRITRRLDAPYPSEEPVALGAEVAATGGFSQSGVTGRLWRLSSEVVELSGERFTRARLGTQAGSHDIGDSMSPVKEFKSGGRAHGAWGAILRDMLVDFFGAGDAAVYFDDANIAAENSELGNLNVYVRVVRVSKFKEVLADLCMGGQVALFVDIHTGKLAYRANTQFQSADTMAGELEIVDSPVVVKTMPGLQKTRTSMKFVLRDPTDNRSYQRHALLIDTATEAHLGYRKGDAIDNQFAVSGEATAARRVQRYSIMPLEVKYKLRTADYLELSLSDLVAINYPEAYQSIDGRAQTMEALTMEYAVDLVAGKTAVMGWVVNRIAGRDGSEQVFNVLLEGIVEDVNIYDRVGQPSAVVNVNVIIADNTLIGGVSNVAMRISGFAAGSNITFQIGSNVMIVGRAGRGRGHGMGIDMQSGTIGLVITGNINIHFDGGFDVRAGGGGGGAGYIVDNSTGRSLENRRGGNGVGYLSRSINTITAADPQDASAARSGAGGRYAYQGRGGGGGIWINDRFYNGAQFEPISGGGGSGAYNTGDGSTGDAVGSAGGIAGLSRRRSIGQGIVVRQAQSGGFGAFIMFNRHAYITLSAGSVITTGGAPLAYFNNDRPWDPVI